MDNLKSTEDAKKYARLLKNFYGELYTYILSNAAIIFVWFVFFSAGHFWPIWILLIWGVSLLIKASKLHVIDHTIYQECDKFRERLVFMKKDWEERKVEQLVKRAQENGLFEESKSAKSKPAAEKAEKAATPSRSTAGAAPSSKASTATSAAGQPKAATAPKKKAAAGKKAAAKKPAVKKS